MKLELNRVGCLQVRDVSNQKIQIAENIASEHLIKSIKEAYLSSETKIQKTYFIDLNIFECNLEKE